MCGTFKSIGDFSYFKGVLTVVLNSDFEAMVEKISVKSGVLAFFEDVTLSLILANALTRIVSRTEATGNPLTLVGSHACATRTAPNCQSQQCADGTYSECIWDEKPVSATYQLAVGTTQPQSMDHGFSTANPRHHPRPAS
jgi:hypothetical protein